MPHFPRPNGANGASGASGSDSHASGRGRQRLKLAATGYFCVRHGVDASEELSRAAVDLLCKTAVEFVGTLGASHTRGRRLDLYRQGDSQRLQLAAIAYASTRHGIDADVGMAREGLAMLCQAAIDYVESLPKEDTGRRSAEARFQIEGAR